MSSESSTDDDSVTVERRSPEDVFGLLGSEVRVEILRALGETPYSSVSFSTLQDRVDVRDSGNFNYHLEKLLGSFVRKDGGYELTHAGQQIVGAMHAGTYTANASMDPFDLDWDCLLCGGGMVAAYDEEYARVYCEDCEKGARFAFPPGTLAQFDREELPGAFGRWVRSVIKRAIAGFCNACGGRVEGELARLPGGTEADPKPSRVVFNCPQCESRAQFSGSSLATFQPRVEAFFADHDLDVTAGHASRAWSQLDVFESMIRSRNPPRLHVVFAYEGERVVVEIEADASVDRIRREEYET